MNIKQHPDLKVLRFHLMYTLLLNASMMFYPFSVFVDSPCDAANTQARPTHRNGMRTTCRRSTSPNKARKPARTFPSRINWSCMAPSFHGHFTQKFGSEKANQAESNGKPAKMRPT